LLKIFRCRIIGSMKLRWVLLLGLVCACNGKDKPAAGNVSAVVGGSAVVADAATVAIDAARVQPATDGGRDAIQRRRFDTASSGEWTLVQLHFSVPPQ
jgi:hypothetical protein